MLLIQDYTYSRLKHYTYSRYSTSYLERPNYGLQNKWKGFSSQLFYFSSITKATENNFMVKYIQYVHNSTVVPKYKNLVLHVNIKLVPFAPNLTVHSLSLISILVGNSMIF